jgi:AcrR family transcriptional regulator
MARTRDSALAGARRVLAEVGPRRASMVDIAVRGGMAKATLYNHFRTKDEVIHALVLAEAEEILRDALTVQHDAAKSLARAAWRLCTHSVLRGAVRAEPVITANIIASFPAAPVWSECRALISQWLTAVGLVDEESVQELLLRWLTTTALMPASMSADADAQALLAQATLVVSSLNPTSPNPTSPNPSPCD